MTEIGDFGKVSKYLKRVETLERGRGEEGNEGKGHQKLGKDETGKISRHL